MATDFENMIKGRQKVKFKRGETKGESFRKKIKEAVERGEEKKLPKRDPKKIMEIDKSLKKLKEDFRFPKKGGIKEKPPIEFKRRKPPNKPRRVPGEKKEMIPLRPEGMKPMAKGGRAGFKAGSKGCKLATKDICRAPADRKSVV